MLERNIALLSRTPPALDALLHGLPDAWTHQNEGAGSWNVLEVLGHMIEGERSNWLPRVRFLLEFGESKAFEPFDRTPVANTSLDGLLDHFTELRSSNLALLKQLALQPDDLVKTGMHPAFGRVTLGQLISTWAVHDLTHLSQISRVLAHQSREAVGPWVEYLGVLRRGSR